MMTGNFIVLKSLGISLPQLSDIVWYVVSLTTTDVVVINRSVFLNFNRRVLKTGSERDRIYVRMELDFAQLTAMDLPSDAQVF